MTSSVFVTGAVEGITDEALLRRICSHVGGEAGTIYGKNGKRGILNRLAGYNHSAQHRHWTVLVDLDHDGNCAPEVLPIWLPHPAPLMRLRIAIRELEAWILADAEHAAAFLGVRVEDVPEDPDSLDDPKQALVTLASGSRKADIRDDLVPRPGSGLPVGPAYASRIIEFVQDIESGWQPDAAAVRSESLRRCLLALRQLVGMPYPPSL